MSRSDEKVLIDKFLDGHFVTFETLFHHYYGYLCSYAEKITHNHTIAEEIVQDFFVQLWEKRDQISIESSLKNYLFRSIKNKCLNYIQHERIHEKYKDALLSEQLSNEFIDKSFVEIDLAKKIEESIMSLPDKRREIFRLSREDGLKYHEIAKKLNISPKTVEAQMTLAIKHLRNKLIDYLSMILIILNFIK